MLTLVFVKTQLLVLYMAYFLGKGKVRLLVEEAEQIGFVHRQDLLDGLAALVEGGDVLLHGVS